MPLPVLFRNTCNVEGGIQEARPEKGLKIQKTSIIHCQLISMMIYYDNYYLL